MRTIPADATDEVAADSAADDPVDTARSGIAFWVSAAVGGAIVAFGIRGLWVNERRGFPSAAKWFVGGALAFDLILVPLGAAVGWVVKRLVPGWTWPVVRAVLLTSVLLIAFAAPLALNQGGVPSNPTVRPRDYTAGLLLALGATWLLGAASLVVVTMRRRHRPHHPTAPTEGFTP